MTTAKQGDEFLVRGSVNKTYIIDRIVRRFGKLWVESVQAGCDRMTSGYRLETLSNFRIMLGRGYYLAK